MKIALIRHGETDWNKNARLQGREDIPLNETGLAQAEAAAVFLSGDGSAWEAIITSPLSRARRTAEIIAEKTGINIIIEEADFIEREMGEVSGLTMEERKAKFPDGKFGGMETLEALQQRITGALFKYAAQFSGRNIIIVSHGAAINSLLAFLSNNEIGTGKTMLKNGCLSVLEGNGMDFRVEFYNREL
jgi:uncharacterized phosphatase